MKRLQELADDWPRLNRLLDEALELEPARRADWLGALPAEHAGLRDTLAQLLQAHGGIETGQLLHTMPRLDGLAAAPGSDAGLPVAGDAVGPWRLIRELGQGGMGSVWLAERADGQLTREVALKLPRWAWVPGLAERLARERDILAALTHPHIARLYDAGVDAVGRPWLAMEYVDGLPLTDWCAQRDSDVAERLRLLLQVADAVAAAHARLVVHRDLKPANVLVTPDGRAMLLDFGIAGLLRADGAAGATLVGPRALTLEYASPEQVRGEPLGTASDVYSLGVVAFELLAGARPYRPRRASTAALEDAIEHEETPRASRVCSNPARARALRGDLDAILAKALQKRAADRYPSVEALSRDWRRHLAFQPVLAQAPSPAYVALKFLRRHRVPVAAGVLATASLMAGLVVALQQARAAEAARAVADGARIAAEQAQRVAEAANAQALAARQEAEQQAQAARQAQDEALRAAERARAQSVRARRAADQTAAVRDYLVEVFRKAGTSQAGVAEARTLTAADLVLRGADSVESLSGRAPEVQIELLDVFGSVLMQTGQLQRAVALRRRAVQLATAHLGPRHRDTLWLRVSLAQALAAAGDSAGAREQLHPARQQLAQVAPQSVAMAHALIHTARLEVVRDPPLAERSARDAIRLIDVLRQVRDGRPVDPWLADNRAHALVFWGRALVGLGRHDEGLQRLREATGQLKVLYGEATVDVDEALAWQVEALWAQGRVAEAEAQASERVARLESFSVRRPEWVAAAHLQRARLLLDAGRGVEARAAIDRAQAVRRELEDPQPHARPATLEGFRLIAAIDGEGRPDTLAALEALLRQNHVPLSQRGELHLLLSQTLARRGDAERARAHLASGRRIAQELPGAWRLQRLLAGQ